MSSTENIALKNLVHIDKKLSTSIFIQLSKGIVEAINKGLIQANEKLPSIRKMAALYSIHHKTVVAAYEDLEAQGWIETIPRKGVYISKVLPIVNPVLLNPTKNTTPIIFTPQQHSATTITHKQQQYIIDDGFADHRLAPMDILLREYKTIMQKPYAIKAAVYGEYTGAEALRIQLSNYLRQTRGLVVDKDNICITRGAQMALYLTCRTFFRKGMKIIVADPNYPIANDVFLACEAKLIYVKVESDGIDVTEIKKLCSKQKIDALYIIPHHHHPTTVTLSVEKRITLLEIINRYDLLVIEDDYDFNFHYDSSPVLPLSSYLTGAKVFYIGSLSKTISNSLRIGFVCASPAAIQAISNLRRLVDLRGDTFFELALAHIIRNGTLAKHIKRSIKLYKERRDLMYDTLKEELGDVLHIDKPKGGMAFWAVFQPPHLAKNIASCAQKKGLIISNGLAYNTPETNYNAIRIGFASKNEKEMEAIVAILKEVSNFV